MPGRGRRGGRTCRGVRAGHVKRWSRALPRCRPPPATPARHHSRPPPPQPCPSAQPAAATPACLGGRAPAAVDEPGVRQDGAPGNHHLRHHLRAVHPGNGRRRPGSCAPRPAPEGRVQAGLAALLPPQHALRRRGPPLGSSRSSSNVVWP